MEQNVENKLTLSALENFIDVFSSHDMDAKDFALGFLETSDMDSSENLSLALTALTLYFQGNAWTDCISELYHLRGEDGRNLKFPKIFNFIKKSNYIGMLEDNSLPRKTITTANELKLYLEKIEEYVGNNGEKFAHM